MLLVKSCLTSRFANTKEMLFEIKFYICLINGSALLDFHIGSVFLLARTLLRGFTVFMFWIMSECCVLSMHKYTCHWFLDTLLSNKSPFWVFWFFGGRIDKRTNPPKDCFRYFVIIQFLDQGICYFAFIAQNREIKFQKSQKDLYDLSNVKPTVVFIDIVNCFIRSM